MDKNTPHFKRIRAILAGNKFFWFVLALFGLQAAWIALSGNYPMAFDEDFHLGVIRVYAHHIGPFWAGQPEAADKFGAVARDPSYLYQYIFSFPYRLISLFTADQTIQVIILRFLNIGLFAAGLALYRRLLLKTGISKAITHISLLFFILLPVVPLLAAQINYDNLLLPLTALALLLTIKFDDGLRRGRLDVATLLWLLIVCLLTSLVKYAFLPLFICIIGFILFRMWQLRRLPKGGWRLKLRGAGLHLGLVGLLLISSVMFMERYGLNLLHYHTPVPDCSKVLSVEQCKEYGPWIRDYNLKIANFHVAHNPVTYSGEWFYGMWIRSFFTLGGPGTDYETRGPMIMPGFGAICFGGLAVVAFLVRAKRLFRLYNAPLLGLFIVVAVGYVGALWLDEYQAFLHTGQPVAINGRYLLPVLPPLILIAATTINELFKKWEGIRASVALIAVVCMLWGGGALTFILRSNDNWYWPNQAVRTANHSVQDTLGPITPGFYRQTQFLH